MNLLFRKNFREGAAGKSAGGGSGSKLQSKATRTKRARDMGGGMSPSEDIHYRTHLFFAPNRGGYEPTEERCSAFSGAYNSYPITTTTTQNIQSSEVDIPQPLVDRRPSVSLGRWNNQSIKLRNENNTNLNENQLNNSSNSPLSTTMALSTKNSLN